MKTAKAKLNPKAQILVVDDHPIVREGLVGLINRQSDMTCCADVGTAAAAQEAVGRRLPDLAVIDLRLGKSDGLELIKALSACVPGLRIVVLSQLDQATFAERALRAGARGYVMKEQAADELLGAIRTVLAGQVYVPRGLAVRLLRSIVGAAPKSLRSGVELLSDRELQVLQLLGTGLTSRKIATELNLSLKTVETHRENIKRKLGLANAAELVHYAVLWSRQQVSVPEPSSFPGLPEGSHGPNRI